MKTALGTIAVLLCLAALGVSALTRGNFAINLCNDQPAWMARSPDRLYESVVFIRDCGASTGFSTHVVLSCSATHCDLKGPEELLAIDGLHYVGLNWISPTELVVSYKESGSRIWKKPVAGIPIRVFFEEGGTQ